MKALKYTVIKSEEQYYEYCDLLEELDFSDSADDFEDEIELLTLLIKTWDDEHSSVPEMDPVELLLSLMEDHELKPVDMVDIAGVGKSTISGILNYKRRMSKNVIRSIANHFKIQQEALNKPYRLEGEGISNLNETSFSLFIGQNIDNTVNSEDFTEDIPVENYMNIYRPAI